MRTRVLATYVIVAVVNAAAGWLHLARGDEAIGWAFIAATLVFLRLGWEADVRLPARPSEIAPAGPGNPLAAVSAGGRRPAGGRRRGGGLDAWWLGAWGLACGALVAAGFRHWPELALTFAATTLVVHAARRLAAPRPAAGRRLSLRR